MNRKHVMIVGVSISLLFYFLFPVVEIGLLCHGRDSKLNENPKVTEAAIPMLVKTSMFMYTIFLLNGEQLEMDGRICTPTLGHQ